MKRREFLIKSTFTALATSIFSNALPKRADAGEKQNTLMDQTIHPRVLVAANASLGELYAAKELITYLEKITGQNLQIEQTDEKPSASVQKPLIVIGSHPLNDALTTQITAMEETIIDVQPGIVHLAGGKPVITQMPNGTQYMEDRGALYAVYNFLDELGVRWYRPEDWGEHVPRAEAIKVLLGRRQYKPVYPWRQGFSGYRYVKDETPEQKKMGVVWAIRNRQNSNTKATEEQGGQRLVMTWHSYSLMFPPEKYFSEHPEYYALIDGERRKDGQLCVGNPQVQNLAAQKALEFAKADPRYITFSLEPNDTNRWCQCGLCKAMDDPEQKTISGKSILSGGTRPMGDISMNNRVCAFGKIVAEKVAQSNSKIKLLWLAYSTHTEPPSKIKSLPSNVYVQPAPFSSAFRDPLHSYSDYSRDLYDPESIPNQNFVRVLKGFGKMAPLLTHEYRGGLAWMGPMPLIRTMKDRLSVYRDLRVQGLYSEIYSHWGPQGIGLYFFTRLLWNPDLDIEKELDLYCKNYYGPAYKPMLQYHTLLEDAAHDGIPFYSYGIKAHQIFVPRVVEQMGKYINEAKVLIGDKQPYAKRFEGVWAGYEYTRLVMPYFNELQKGNKLEAAKHWERANKFILFFKDGSVFDNGVLFGSLQFFGNYNLNIPANIQKQAKNFVAQEKV